jgi:16S rRNA (cytosine967-C5)-methyltransferase
MNDGETSSQNYFHRHINYAISILEKYNGREPFHLYLKQYFSQNKKHGSKDRKQIASLCYDYFRIGIAVNPEIAIAERILIATFLIEKKSSSILEKRKPEWYEKITLDLSEKIETIKDIFSLEKLFPFKNQLSGEIDFYEFSLSFLIQPKLFIRIRPGYENAVFDKLKSAQISFQKINETCLAFTNNEKISDIIKIDKEAVIQDYNSQQTLKLFTSYIAHQKSEIKNHKSEIRNFSVWDCCAASGGKSILAFDLIKNIQLTVTDTRKLILENLHKRFGKSGIKNYRSSVADLSESSSLIEMKERFDLIIADVPCSGSGTWSRTPEQLIFFQEKKVEEYSFLQRKIVCNVVKKLKENGFLLYITCSVFKNENEENINFFHNNLELELIEAKYVKGYQMQSDTLFAGLFKKKT